MYSVFANEILNSNSIVVLIFHFSIIDVYEIFILPEFYIVLVIIFIWLTILIAIVLSTDITELIGISVVFFFFSFILSTFLEQMKHSLVEISGLSSDSMYLFQILGEFCSILFILISTVIVIYLLYHSIT